MKEMKVRCTSREHADRVIEAAKRLGYLVVNDYMRDQRLDTMVLNDSGTAGFWPAAQLDYPEYALYGDHLLPVSDGWIENENKGICPVAKGTKIDVLYRDGAIVRSVGAKDGSRSKVEGNPGDRRAAISWGRYGGPGDIIAYRLAAAADAPVEWDGTGELPVGARVVIPRFAPYSEGPLSGVIVLPADSEGDYVIKDDDGVYWWAPAGDLRPVRSAREKAVADIALDIRAGMSVGESAEEIAEQLYDQFFGKTEANDG